MLPTPVQFYSRKYGPQHHHKRPWRDVLLTRARVTNLGFILLLTFFALSFLLNLYYWFRPEPRLQLQVPLPRSILATIARDEPISSLEHLVIVPGHSIWKGSRETRLRASMHTTDTYPKDIVTKDQSALLIFSGGNTKSQSPHTEASSYHQLSLVTNLISSSFTRVTTEEDALDSFQNLIFSIARFHEYTGRYPTRITVVGYEMKRKRFEELHRAAIRWPLNRFEYIGIDAEGQDIERAREGEEINGYIPYMRDIYGCHGVLLSKRRSRNPHIRYHPYFISAPELGALFNWCPVSVDGVSNELFRGPLPWDRLHPKPKAFLGVGLGKGYQ
ncbi:hypothetical protein BDY19DRAFT_941410 [Irpex rosettiformis]|uniref:Uncharacterized protein n=1 Tax=Irpex rosettiformis TaxID=378272 RepID=A0ACB8U6D5_9APHY|nr:hypothetical protein BDY19DRAFT_941410 [Irpex rosettiformis]